MRHGPEPPGRPFSAWVDDGPTKTVTPKEKTSVAKITKTFQYGKHTVTLETGEVARQASGAVIVKLSLIHI